MIHLIYQPGWDSELKQDSQINFCSRIPHAYPSYLHLTLPELVHHVIDQALIAFDDAKSLKGFLAFSDADSGSLTPFSVTSHYCIRVLHCSLQGAVRLSVSPIYHLGLDYPEVYQHREGKSLDPKAMLGVVEITGHEKSINHQFQTDGCDGHLFRYGIDAGVAFKDSSIEHNRAMNLKLALFEDCLLSTFHSKGQVSSQTLLLEEVMSHEEQAYNFTETNTFNLASHPGL